MYSTDASDGRPLLSDDAHPNVRRLIAYSQSRSRDILAAGNHLPVRSVGVVGAGVMGAAVAAVSLAAGLRVVLCDTEPAARRRAPQTVRDALAALRQNSDTLVEERLQIAPELDALAPCELVLESITERLDVKRRVHAALEDIVAEEAVLATNTSTIPIGRLAAELRRPRRFLGLHFFHPVGRRPLVELIPQAETSAATVATAIGYAHAIHKLVLPAADGPGFVVNRLLMPYVSEAIELLTDGVPIERVEAVARNFGMALGPLRLVDEIGLDTVVAGGRVLWEAFPSRVVISPVMIAMYKAGRFGVKAGAGFFCYDTPSPAESPTVDPVALAKIAEWTRAPRDYSNNEIRDRLLLPMVLEATRLLEEHKLANPRDVDLGVLFGLGFPAARGGLLCWADTLGAPELVARLDALEPRHAPTDLLQQMAADGRTFYD